MSICSICPISPDLETSDLVKMYSVMHVTNIRFLWQNVKSRGPGEISNRCHVISLHCTQHSIAQCAVVGGG